MDAAFLLLVLIAALPCRGTDYTPVELPRDTTPYAYALRLVPTYDPDHKSFQFAGHVEIRINVNWGTLNVTLNARDLRIKSVSVIHIKTMEALEVEAWTLYPKAERLIVTVGRRLLAGHQYNVKIRFHGLLRTDMTGFYRSMYSVNNETKWMAVTQFKPTNARRAFPCYDEPRYKTPFNISLGRQIYQMTLSNTNRYLTEWVEYYKSWLDHYTPTSPISTYMVAGMVGELKQVSSNDTLSIYTHDDYVSLTTYAQEESPALVETMENYTSIPSETLKMVYLAAPDMEAEGVENMGLNIYRERYVLIEKDAKTKFREQSTMVIQQMQNHQWFGNLVTCSKWDFMWLNEGFARYFQYFATKQAKLDWRMEDLFVIEQHQTALEYDQIPRHPITTSLVTPEDASNIIDRITYNKAAAFLRMLSYTVTENNFHQPLKIYLQQFKHNIASPDELWSVFEKYYNDTGFQLHEFVSFTKFVHSWTDQSGYPVVNVAKKNDMYSITQALFSVWPNNNTATQWYVGLSYTDNLENNFEKLEPIVWLKPSSTVTVIRNISLADWVIFNVQWTGFYRVNYDQANWNQLIKQLNKSHTAIHVLNRAQLIDDSFNLARAGIVKYTTALDLSTYLYNEDDFIPWHAAIDCLSYVVERMRRSPGGYDSIKSYVRSLADLIYTKTESLIKTYNSKDHLTLTSWNKFSVWACYYDGENCLRNAKQNFKTWMAGIKISPDVKDAAFCTNIKYSNDTSLWKYMFNVYMTTNSFSEKNSAQSALTCTEDSVMLNNYLDMIFNADKGGPVRLQDFYDIVTQMALTPTGIEALLKFLINNLNDIIKTIQAGEKIVTYIYSVLATKVAIDSEIVQLYQLKISPKLPPKIKASFEESYVYVEQNLHWYQINHDTINQWTAPFMTSTTPTPTTPTTTTPTTTTPTTTTPTPTTPTPTTPTPTTSTPITPTETTPTTTTPKPTTPTPTTPTPTTSMPTTPMPTTPTTTTPTTTPTTTKLTTTTPTTTTTSKPTTPTPTTSKPTTPTSSTPMSTTLTPTTPTSPLSKNEFNILCYCFVLSILFLLTLITFIFAICCRSRPKFIYNNNVNLPCK